MRGGYDNLNALVLGAALSGEWAARLLLSRGCRVTVLDEGDGVKLADAAARIGAAGGAVRFGKGDLPDGAFDVCVASPAFAMSHAWIAACAARGVPVISELELGACYWRGRILAVTGSKGKSSLVKFCADTLNLSGVTASPAGNYGIPLCQLVMERPDVAWAVAEVSSFQMEHSPTFHPQVAVLLNLQPDHLDRHADFAEYKQLKLRMFANMGEGDCALLPQGLDAEGMLPASVPCFRFGDTPDCDWRYAASCVYGGRASSRAEGAADIPVCRQGQCADRKVCASFFVVNIAGTWFDNEVLGFAAAAGVAALHAAGLSASAIDAGFKRFEPLAHRVQDIGTDARGVTWVDDSKATSLTATAAALRMVRKPVRLIAGGLLKENDLFFLKDLLAETTQKVYLIGKCAGQMAEAWASAVPCEIYGTIERAVSAVAQEAQSGETALLSPGTASFDQFGSYRERGERFTQLARAVAGL